MHVCEWWLNVKQTEMLYKWSVLLQTVYCTCSWQQPKYGNHLDFSFPRTLQYVEDLGI